LQRQKEVCKMIAGNRAQTSGSDQLMGKVGASSLFVNLGVNGSTTTGMIDKIVRALGVVEWNFLDGAGPVIDPYAYGDGDYNQTTDTLDGTHPTMAGHTTIMNLAMAQLYERKRARLIWQL